MTESYERKRVQILVMTAIMTALVMSVTLFTKIPLPTGYLNLGDFVVMIAACIMPFRMAAFAAGVGSAMADLAGYPMYAIFTFFIKIVEVLIVVRFAKLLDTKYRFVPFVLASLSMLILYGLVDAFFASQFEYIGVSMLSNLPQGLASSALAIILYPQFIRLKKYVRGMTYETK